MDNDSFYYGKEPNKVWKNIKLVLKILIFSFILFMYAFFIFRICSSEPSEAIKKVVWTQNTIDALNSQEKKLEMYTQTPHVYISDDGKMAFFDLIYIPSVKQLQMTVRYNISTLDALKTDFELDSIEGEPFAYSLLLSDGQRINSYVYTAEKTSRYYMRHLVFDGVNFEDFELVTPDTSDTGAIYVTDENGKTKQYDISNAKLEAYYIDSVNFDADAYISLEVFTRDLKLKKYDYSDYIPENGQIAENIKTPPYYIEKKSK